MDISTFDDLLQAARAQPDPQRLLLVFAGAELPDDSNAAQRQRFEAGEGGALVPLMCVDKTPGELASFDSLVQESAQFGHDWRIVFAAAMGGGGGAGGRAPSSEDAEAPLQRMVEMIRQGQHGSFIPFDRHGQAVRLS